MKINVLIFVLASIVLIFGSFLLWDANNNKNNKIPSQIVDNSLKDEDLPQAPDIGDWQVPILMYHYIRIADAEDSLGVALSVTPTNFDTQMQWLKENDYISIRLADLADPAKTVISKVKQMNKKPIVITFDDGYRDAYTEAFPIIKKYNYLGTFFVIRDFLGRLEYLTAAQIDEMNKDGMEMGSHSLSHKNLALSSLETQRKQIFDSKLDAQVFCYPSGRYTQETADLAKEAGYLAAVTTKDGIADQNSNLFELPRVRIKNINLETFSLRVRGLK